MLRTGCPYPWPEFQIFLLLDVYKIEILLCSSYEKSHQSNEHLHAWVHARTFRTAKAKKSVKFYRRTFEFIAICLERELRPMSACQLSSVHHKYVFCLMNLMRERMRTNAAMFSVALFTHPAMSTQYYDTRVYKRLRWFGVIGPFSTRSQAFSQRAQRHNTRRRQQQRQQRWENRCKSRKMMKVIKCARITMILFETFKENHSILRRLCECVRACVVCVVCT